MVTLIVCFGKLDRQDQAYQRQLSDFDLRRMEQASHEGSPLPIFCEERPSRKYMLSLWYNF
jgi:hypothetical protein